MYILAINGSHRTNSNSEAFLDYILQKFGPEHTTEKINLLEKDIKFCNACEKCIKTEKCELADDMSEIYEKLLRADVLIFATPTYYGMPSARLKNFMDRTDCYIYNKKLKKKIGAVITSGAGVFAGIELCAKNVRHFFDAHDMYNVPVYCCFNNTKDFESHRFPKPLGPDITSKLDELQEYIMGMGKML